MTQLVSSSNRKDPSHHKISKSSEEGDATENAIVRRQTNTNQIKRINQIKSISSDPDKFSVKKSSQQNPILSPHRDNYSSHAQQPQATQDQAWHYR